MTPWGSYKFVVKDPDGHLLAFVQGEENGKGNSNE
jgi:hypothetical protein